MKTSESYHERKVEAVQIINRLFLRHGNGLNVEIKIQTLCVDVRVSKSHRPTLTVIQSNFSVDVQAGDGSEVIRLAEEQMESAMKECGAEFTSMREFKEEAKAMGVV